MALLLCDDARAAEAGEAAEQEHEQRAATEGRGSIDGAGVVDAADVDAVDELRPRIPFLFCLFLVFDSVQDEENKRVRVPAH